MGIPNHRTLAGTKAGRQRAAQTGRVLTSYSYKRETDQQREIREWNEAVQLKKAMKK